METGHPKSMRFASQVPGGELKGLVEDYWLYEDYTPSFHCKERILPSGTVELVINLQDNELRIYDATRAGFSRRFSGAIVSGTYYGSFVTDTAEEKSVMGVHFKPGGAFPFLGVPPDELSGTHLDLETLWGRAARDLRDRLCEAKTAAKRFQILEEALAGHIFRPPEHHYAVAAALDEFKRPGVRRRVREIAAEIGLSQRRFIRVFASEVGLTPKRFSRIRRFQEAVSLASASNAVPDWPQLALRCGYFDQSHLIDDFVAFSGLTPGEYFGQLRHLDEHKIQRKRNHVPLVGE
jgi:AraC-like DNA-binding protein